jgi:hypothetical protein
VRQATQERAIDYPVAVDNDYEIWSAFANHYWPALYFVEADGFIRDQHFGEGRYEQSERVIQRLLDVERELEAVEGMGVEAAADWDHLGTPETYFGYARSEHFASPDGAAFGERRAYELPERLPLNHWALAGEWTIGPENVVLDRAGGRIAYGFTHATLTSCWLARRESRFRFACSSTVSRRARQTASTSTRPGMACFGTAACTSSCARTTRSASGRWRSHSSSLVPRRTRSRSGSRDMATLVTNQLASAAARWDRVCATGWSARADDRRARTAGGWVLWSVRYAVAWTPGIAVAGALLPGATGERNKQVSSRKPREPSVDTTS